MKKIPGAGQTWTGSATLIARKPKLAQWSTFYLRDSWQHAGKPFLIFFLVRGWEYVIPVFKVKYRKLPVFPVVGKKRRFTVTVCVHNYKIGIQD